MAEGSGDAEIDAGVSSLRIRSVELKKGSGACWAEVAVNLMVCAGEELKKGRVGEIVSMGESAVSGDGCGAVSVAAGWLVAVET